MRVESPDFFSMAKKEWKESFSFVESKFALNAISLHDLYQLFLHQYYYVHREVKCLLAETARYSRGSKANGLRELYETSSFNHISSDLLLTFLLETGSDISMIDHSYPCPSSVAMISFIRHQVQQDSPLAFAGFVLHWEFLTRRFAKNIYSKLRSIEAIQRNNFVRQFGTFDIPRHRKIRSAFTTIVQSSNDYAPVSYSMNAMINFSAYLTDESLQCLKNQRSWGISPRKLPDWFLLTEKEIYSQLSGG